MKLLYVGGADVGTTLSTERRRTMALSWLTSSFVILRFPSLLRSPLAGKATYLLGARRPDTVSAAVDADAIRIQLEGLTSGRLECPIYPPHGPWERTASLRR